MNRRDFLTSVAVGAAAMQARGVAIADTIKRRELPRNRPLANEFTVVYQSPDPATIYAYSPGLARLQDGRLVATMDQGGAGVEKLPGARRGKWVWRGRIFTSDDRGRTWTHRSDTPMEHARPFVAGNALYVLGQWGDLIIMRSHDRGQTWSEPVELTEGQRWHQAPCNVHYTRGRVYLVMERGTETGLAPVLMSARVGDDLARREAWTFSNVLSFNDAIRTAGPPHLIGVPFYKEGPTVPSDPKNPRSMGRPGWLETNVVQFTDPDHDWYDPSGRTFHLFMRAHTGATNLACLAKAVEADDGRSITVSLENAPSGEPMLYVPFPGGQMKFHILYDEKTRLFWLLSSQSTDSMTRPDRLPANRFNLPNNERHRLALHFSKNCIDWCFAGLVATSGNPGQGRHYASMIIDGDDLHVLSRSGDARAKDAHDGNLITFHTVGRFRELIY